MHGVYIQAGYLMCMVVNQPFHTLSQCRLLMNTLNFWH